MNEQDHHTSEENRLGTMLKQLPKVKATDDFERRLQRRLAEERSRETRKEGFWHYIAGHRVPAFATSFAALLLVSLLSYYLIDRNGAASPSTQPVVHSTEPVQQEEMKVAQADQSSEKPESAAGVSVPVEKKHSPLRSFKLEEKKDLAEGIQREPVQQSVERNDVDIRYAAAPAPPIDSISQPAAEPTLAEAVPDNKEEGETGITRREVTIQTEPANALEQAKQSLVSQQKPREATSFLPFSKGKTMRREAFLRDSLRLDSLKKDSIRKVLDLRRKKKP